jgi:NDP-sugar pyrophosphorylase family protein
VWQHPFGVVHTNGIKIIGFEEKPVHKSSINAGVYVIEPAILKFIERNEVCHMPMLLERAQQVALKIIAYPIHEGWLDVGRSEDLDLARTAEKNFS